MSGALQGVYQKSRQGVYKKVDPFKFKLATIKFNQHNVQPFKLLQQENFKRCSYLFLAHPVQ